MPSTSTPRPPASLSHPLGSVSTDRSVRRACYPPRFVHPRVRVSHHPAPGVRSTWVWRTEEPAARAAVRRRYEPMRPYEVMIIFDADLDEEIIRSAVDRSVQLIESKGAEKGPIDFWGKRRFAYEVKHR